MFKIVQYYIFLLIILVAIPEALGQKGRRIKYSTDKNTGYSEYNRINGKKIRTLVNGVVFTQESTTVYCDSTLFYVETNEMEAYGHVRIIDDSVTITSKKLIYKGDERRAELREQVVYTRGERRLTTDFLNYDLDNEIAHYFNNGKLKDQTNTLTSEIGYFYAQQNYAEFFNKVILIAPDYTLKTDTLKYNTQTKIAYTSGRTEIISNSGKTTLHAKGGVFRTESDQSQFVDGTVETDDYILDGDELYFDDLQKYYKAIGNVSLTAKERDVIITGEEGFYDKESGLSKVYGGPIMKRILKQDTFYLSADTLVAIESDYDSLKRILAYNDVKLYKIGLQGIADSMAYFRKDSIIVFYQDPVMWNNNNQILGDTITLEVNEDEIKHMNLLSNAFMIAEDTIENYNQIKGRYMKAFFEDNKIKQIDVDGNGEILYFALDKGDSVLMGMNKIFCASMKIYFRDQNIINFRVYNKPEGQFIPPHELTKEIQRLENFAWRVTERPELFDVAPYLDPEYDPSIQTSSSDSIKSAASNKLLPDKKGTEIQQKITPVLKTQKPVLKKGNLDIKKESLNLKPDSGG